MLALAVLYPRGEAVDGIASFERIRYRRHDADVFMWAFDLIELDGDDLRGDPLAVRKATLASLLRRAAPGLRFCEHLDHEDGPLVFAHACKITAALWFSRSVAKFGNIGFCPPFAEAGRIEGQLPLAVEQLVGYHFHAGRIFEDHAVGALEIEEFG